MSDQNPDSQSNDNSAEAQRLLVELRQMRAQAEEQLKATEIARKKADDDALYASQAKNNTEEHSKATAVYKGDAETAFNAIRSNKTTFEELVAAVTVGKATIEASVTAIEASRKTAESGMTEIAEASRKAAGNLNEIDAAKASALTLAEEEKKLRDSTAASNAAAAAELANIKALQAQSSAAAKLVDEANAKVTKQSADISALVKAVTADRDNQTKIVEHLSRSDAIATGYEARVAELIAKLNELNERAENLLPGATSAGLAHSFNAQKNRFAEPQKRWLRTFVWCIIGLVVVALPSFVNAVFGIGGESSWRGILLGMAMRLPVVIPLVWLAIYAGRNYMLSLRLEEDYAYKEAVSRSFEGYKREMEKITAGDINNPTPLTKLCLNILNAIAERPGRIYDGKQRDYTMLGEVMDLAKQADEFRKIKTATH